MAQARDRSGAVPHEKTWRPELQEDGTLCLWNYRLFGDGLTSAELLATFDSWKVQACDTMAEVEYLDLLCRNIVVSRYLDGFRVRATSERAFVNRDTGEFRYAEESHPCDHCGKVIQWAEPYKGHEGGCPFMAVHDVMTS